MYNQLALLPPLVFGIWKVGGFVVRNHLVVTFTLGYPRINRHTHFLTVQYPPTRAPSTLLKMETLEHFSLLSFFLFIFKEGLHFVSLCGLELTM